MLYNSVVMCDTFALSTGAVWLVGAPFPMLDVEIDTHCDVPKYKVLYISSHLHVYTIYFQDY